MTRYLACLALLVVATPAWTQQGLTPELLIRLKRVSPAAVSPDGATIVFGVRATDLAANSGNTDLFRMPVAGGEPVRLTDWPGSELEARWRPDGRKIGFLSGQGGSTQLWEINPDGSGARQVSNVDGGIANFRYAPDGRHVSFTRMVKLDRTPAEVYTDLPKAEARIIDELMFRHWDSWRDYRYSHLFVAEYADGALGEPVDVMPNERWDTPLPPFGGVEQTAWRPDGSAIIYTAKKLTGAAAARSTNSDLYLYDLASGRTTNLTELNPGYDVEPVFSPDGRHLAWLSMARDGYEADRNRLYMRDLQSGRSWDATAQLDGDAHSPAWSGDGSRIYFLSESEATVQLLAADLQGGTVRPITRGDHNYTDLAVAGTARALRLIAGRQSISAPTELYRVDPANGEASRLTRFNDSLLAGVRLGQVRRRVVTATDGAKVHTWVIYPPGFDSTQSYPAILYAQGGPQSAVSQFFSYRWNFVI